MKKFIILLVILQTSLLSFPQFDTISLNNKKKDRYVIWLIPSSANNIYGIAIGLIGSETVCNIPYTKYSHGFNLQLFGQGFLQTFYINKVKFNNYYSNDSILINENMNKTFSKRALHNGILASPFGTFTDQINGMSLSLWMSMGKKINGISFNFLWNLYGQINGLSLGLFNDIVITKGIQIGIINKTIKLRGIQIGLWNKNEKRSLPLVNWNFTGKKLEH